MSYFELWALSLAVILPGVETGKLGELSVCCVKEANTDDCCCCCCCGYYIRSVYTKYVLGIFFVNRRFWLVFGRSVFYVCERPVKGMPNGSLDTRQSSAVHIYIFTTQGDLRERRRAHVFVFEVFYYDRLSTTTAVCLSEWLHRAEQR